MIPSLTWARVALIFSAAAVCVTCGTREPAREEDSTRDILRLLSSGDTPVAIRIVPLRDTVTDPRTVEIAYAFYNQGRPREFVINDQFLGFQVIDPDGQTLRRDVSVPIAEANLPLRRVLVPTRSFAGGVVNLACATRLDDPGTTSPGEPCFWSYRFSRPGLYRIVGHYAPIPEPGPSSPEARLDYVRLQTDTAIIILR